MTNVSIMENGNYRYYAFISYSSCDYNWGLRLQKKLEHYKMPSTLCSEHGWERRPLNPIFFAPTEIQPGDLDKELKERLKDSKHLIVICSPSSAKSEWVAKEIRYFSSLGRDDRIHLFIIDGTPYSNDPETECYNGAIKELPIPNILGVNVNDRTQRWRWLDREHAYIQLITKLLGIGFDEIWKRHKRILAEQLSVLLAMSLTVLMTIFYAWYANKPVDIELELQDVSGKNSHLSPLRNALVTVELENETKSDTVFSEESHAVFANVPRKYIGDDVKVRIVCKDFVTLDTVLMLSSRMSVGIQRDSSVYGNVNFRLWNTVTEEPCCNIGLLVDGILVKSDSIGVVSLFIPLERQKPCYGIKIANATQSDTLYMPCGDDDVILIE